MVKSKKNSEGTTLAEEMLAGLRAFARDLDELPDTELKTKYRFRTVRVDFTPRAYNADAVKRLRKSMGCSQRVFAAFIGVSVGTLRNWEQGLRPVSAIAARMFDEMRINPGYWRIRLSQSMKERKAG